jgi:hypothetical protein
MVEAQDITFPLNLITIIAAQEVDNFLLEQRSRIAE